MSGTDNTSADDVRNDGEGRIYSGDLQPGAYLITNGIGPDTTVSDFERMFRAYPEFKLHYGGRCGWNIYGTTAMKGNLESLEYLLKQRRELANLGNGFGWTPIYCCVARSTESEDDIIKKLRLLIEYGADPTLGTLQSCGDSTHGNTRRGATPLDAANRRNLHKVEQYLEKVIGKMHV